MKRIFLTCVGCFFFLSSIFAQYTRWGIAAGVETAKYSINYPISYEDGMHDFQYKWGFKVSVEAEYPLGGSFYLAPELAFTQRGTKQMQRKDNITITGTENINYLQLPVNVMYKYEVASDTKIYIYSGPYISYALSGKLKIHDNTERADTDESLPFSSKKGDYKQMDMGLTLGMGAEYVDYFIRIQYSYGLTNLLNYEEWKYQKNRSIGIALGYLF